LRSRRNKRSSKTWWNQKETKVL